MQELFGFLSAEKLASAIAAWREMEKRARQVEPQTWAIAWVLAPVDGLDREAGMAALGLNPICGHPLASIVRSVKGTCHCGECEKEAG